MRGRLLKLTAVIAVVVLVFSAFAISAAAIDDTYRFDEFGMSMKIPKSYYVITRDTPRGDSAFSEVGLDYDETMTAFGFADIYLRAYDPDKILQISLIVAKDEDSTAVNNYSDLTAAERKAITDTMLGDNTVSSAVEVKHNGNIFFDSERSTSVGSETVYINQCNTVINGYRIDLMLQKSEEPIAPDEAKALTNAANSISFDNIKRNTGAVFEWWRLLLWVGLLAAISLAVSVIYKHNDNAKKRKLEERKARRAAASTETENGSTDISASEEDKNISFEQSLGYKDDEEFSSRAEADEMAGLDISVRERDPNKGVAYFEDEGESIDDGTDYFDTYFKEPTEKRTFFQRFFGTIGTYIKLAFTHTGYFFKNLFNKIFGKKKEK